ncbi:MAG: cytochrome c oxidase subunit II [Halobacteriota archaeon]
MEIHRFEKIWLVVSILLIVGFIATITYGAVGVGVQMVDDSGGTVDPANLEATAFADPGVSAVGDHRYDVHIVARQFAFEPGTNQPIRVPANSTVTFYITSADVVHGFQLVGTNVNTMVVPGQVTKITVKFDEPETYGIVCHEYCGAAHHEMEASLEVVPESEFERNEEGNSQ